MRIDPKLYKVAQSYLSKLKRSKIPVSQAFLFGSHVRGTAHKWSDLDLCVVSPVFGKDYHRELVHLMILRNGLDEIVEPHPYSPTDFENEFDSLAREIKRTGIIVS